MTPEELANLHPRLYHVTAPGAWDSLAKLGLLPAAALLERFEVGAARRAELITMRRRAEHRLEHAAHGTAILSDNRPLSERKLAACLDDGLSPQDWLALLNERVFFWVDDGRVADLVGAMMNRGRSREVLAFDTLGLARAHTEQVEISPINSGSTLRRPARRGATTFAPLLATSYATWRRQRGKRDRIVEVVVRGGVPDVARYLVGRRTVEPPGCGARAAG